jgi:hypothetical protein
MLRFAPTTLPPLTVRLFAVSLWPEVEHAVAVDDDRRLRADVGRVLEQQLGAGCEAISDGQRRSDDHVADAGADVEGARQDRRRPGVGIGGAPGERDVAATGGHEPVGPADRPVDRQRAGIRDCLDGRGGERQWERATEGVTGGIGDDVLDPPFQLPEADHRPFVTPIQVWVAPSAGAAPINASVHSVATEQTMRRIGVMWSLPLDRYADSNEQLNSSGVAVSPPVGSTAPCSRPGRTPA